jgi:hypothetical protein
MSTPQDNPVLDLCNAFLEGYGWGLHALQHRPVSQDQLKNGLPAALPEGLKEGLTAVFSLPEPGPSTIDAIDAVIDRFPAHDGIREYIADLLALRLILETDAEDDFDEDDDEEADAEEDPRWTTLEALFETRGTEVLHVLSYLRQCKEDEEEPTLDGFLNDFALNPEDEDQTDFFVYEELIKQIEIVDGPLRQLIEAGNAQSDDVMAELFTPLTLFFREQEDAPAQLTLAVLNHSTQPALHAAIYRMLCAYFSADI